MPEAPDLTADYLALRRSVGAVWLARDGVRVVGPDALAFLQGQLSQDIAGLGVGEAALSFLLQPQGKVVALLRIIRMGDDEAVLDTDAGWGPAIAERLLRFKLRVKANIAPCDWNCLALRGPQAHEVANRVEPKPAPEGGAPKEPGESPPDVQSGLGDHGQHLAVIADWPGLAGVDLVGETPPSVPDGVRLCALDAYEAVRVEAGMPVMGRELDERTIPAEAGQALVERAVSFTKGCFTGQELVARIDSRGGHVPRRLLGLVIATNVIPPVGASVRASDDPAAKEVGTLTSVATSLDRRAPVALAYVRRGVDPGADVTVAWDGGTAPARVEALPLVS